MNLLMLSGDSSVARGQSGAFAAMLRHFAAHWDRVDILCPGGRDAVPTTLYDTVHVHPSPWPKAMQPLFIRRMGRRLLAQRRYDLITSHDFGFFYNGLGAWWLSRGTGVPVVSEIHHVEGYPRAVTSRERLYRMLAMRYIPLAARYVAAFRVVNRVEVPDLLRRLGVPERQILVLPALYIDFDTFHPLPEETPAYDLLFVGRLVPNKGLFTILQALAQLRGDGRPVTLGILGRGPLQAALRAKAAALGVAGDITWLDRVDTAADVARLYNRARCVVCASSAEGGPRVTVEAMACGVPVITTPVGVMRELIREGENGLLFDGCAAMLAGQVRRLLDDDALRARIARAGQEAVQGFRQQDVIAAYARGYHDLISQLEKRG